MLLFGAVLAAVQPASHESGSTPPDITGPPREPRPEVDTSKNCYLPGEVVTIILRNVGLASIRSQYIPNFIVENATIGVVREAIGGYPFEDIIIPPGGNMTWIWDATWERFDGKKKGELVPPANYDAVIQVLVGFPIPELVEVARAPFSIGDCIAQVHAGEDFFVTEGENFTFRPVIEITGNATVTSITWDLDPSLDANGDGNGTNDLDLVGETPFHTFGDDGIYPVVMNLRGFGTIESKIRLDQDVVFVLDGSASMATSDPNMLRKVASKAYVDRLVPDDRAAVVEFTTGATLVRNHHLSMNYSQVKSDIDLIGAKGGKIISSGIFRGLSELRDYGDSEHVWLEILITDGESSEGGDQFQLGRAITHAKGLGVKIYTVGIHVQDPVVEERMRFIANETGGKYFPAATADNLAQILQDVSEDVNQTEGEFFVVTDTVFVTVQNAAPSATVEAVSAGCAGDGDGDEDEDDDDSDEEEDSDEDDRDDEEESADNETDDDDDEDDEEDDEDEDCDDEEAEDDDTVLVRVDSGTNVTIWERTGDLNELTYSVATLIGGGATFDTVAREHYNFTSDGVHLRIHSFRDTFFNGSLTGNNIAAARLDGVPGFPSGIYASTVVNYTVGFGGIAGSRVNALGTNLSDHTWMGDQDSELLLGFTVVADDDDDDDDWEEERDHDSDDPADSDEDEDEDDWDDDEDRDDDDIDDDDEEEDAESNRSSAGGSGFLVYGNATDPGSDDLMFIWDWGDGAVDIHTYFHNGVAADPFPSPGGGPTSVSDLATHSFGASGTYTVTLTIIDDDDGTTVLTFVLTVP